MKINSDEIYKLITTNKNYNSAYKQIKSFKQTIDILMVTADENENEFLNITILAIHNLIAIITLYNNIISKDEKLCEIINRELLKILTPKMLNIIKKDNPDFFNKYIDENNNPHNDQDVKCYIDLSNSQLSKEELERLKKHMDENISSHDNKDLEYNLHIGDTNINQLTQEQIDMAKEKNWTLIGGFGDEDDLGDDFQD